MRLLTCLIAAGMFAVAAIPAGAATVSYGEAFDTLYRIDLETRTASPIGSAGFLGSQRIGNISGLTLLGDGSAYAVSGSLKALLRINLSSGSSQVIGNLGLSDQGSGQFDALDLGMTSDCDDVLWLVSGTLQQLWRVDPASGTPTLVGSTGHSISGLVADGDALYGTGGDGDHTLYRVNKSDASATAIGSFGTEAPAALNSVSMSFAEDGTLWAVLNYVPPASGSVTPDWSDLAVIDPETGRMTLKGPITGPEALRQVGMKGFATSTRQCPAGSAPVAAPVVSIWGLLALCMLLPAAVFFRQRELRECELSRRLNRGRASVPLARA
ncbi:hypothetical protein [Dokdonella sp.]|uniref:hypothetical protein n=1 Tax=Dokdonella sp. TaxID=2291710 RepID=UPI0037838DA0